MLVNQISSWYVDGCYCLSMDASLREVSTQLHTTSYTTPGDEFVEPTGEIGVGAASPSR